MNTCATSKKMNSHLIPLLSRVTPSTVQEYTRVEDWNFVFFHLFTGSLALSESANVSTSQNVTFASAFKDL